MQQAHSAKLASTFVFVLDCLQQVQPALYSLVRVLAGSRLCCCIVWSPEGNCLERASLFAGLCRPGPGDWRGPLRQLGQARIRPIRLQPADHPRQRGPPAHPIGTSRSCWGTCLACVRSKCMSGPEARQLSGAVLCTLRLQAC